MFSVDPGAGIVPISGTQTVLADTSITNLLAELPVLETEANGVNLGLQLADGAQVHFASTAGLATFLYALAAQQMQATSFVTDNYHLDTQWLNTIDQPLLDEAVCWSNHAAWLQTLGGATYNEQAVEFNAMASLALQIAAQAPGSRHDVQADIHNALTGNPTQITVYANGSGGVIHDLAPSIWQQVLGALSTVLNIAALVTGQDYLYFAAAAVDAAEAGEAFANGEILPGILDLAQVVAAGIGGAVGTPLPGAAPTTAQVMAQVINAAVQGVGGVYGIVQSAETGNAAGILAGALEAAAAVASGIALLPGQDTQTLNAIAAVTGTAGIATTVANDFNTGNLGQGLVDSLNLYLPAVAQASLNYFNSVSQVQQPLQMDAAAIASAAGNPAPGITIPDFGSIASQAEAAAASSSSGSSSSGVTATVTQVQPDGLGSVGSSAGGGVGIVITQGGATYVADATPTPPQGAGASTTPDTISATVGSWLDSSLWFMNSVFGVTSAGAAPASAAGGLSINWQLIISNEGGVLNSGGVPNQNGVVLGTSGMTIGAGVDIGGMNVSGLQYLVQNYGLWPELVPKLTPYLGIKGQAALAFVQANPITLYDDEVANLDSAVSTYKAAQFAASFNGAEAYGSGFTFGMLPGNTQTALMDMYWEYARTSNGFLTKTQLWTQITTGQWSAAVNNIATWAPVPTHRNQSDSNLVLQDLNAGLLPTIGHH